MRRLLTALTIACLLAPAAARADSGTDKLIIDACRDEKIDGTYTQAQYKKALEDIPSDSDEYTACREVLERGRLAALNKKHDQSNGGGGGTTGGGTTGGGTTGGGTSNGGGGTTTEPAPKPTAKQQKAIAQAAQTAQPVEIGGKLVQPGELGMGALSGSGHSVPTSLAALLALLTASALGGGCWWLWSRVLARRFG